MEYVHVTFTLEVPDGKSEEAADKTVDAIVDAAEAGGWAAVGATHPMTMIHAGTDCERLTCCCDPLGDRAVVVTSTTDNSATTSVEFRSADS